MITDGCNKDIFPKDYKKDQCNTYWRMADTTVKGLDDQENRELYDEFKDAHRIRIYKQFSMIPNKVLLECYNPAIIAKHGWCQIADEPIDKWGVCSHSCQFMKVRKASEYSSKKT